MSHEHHSVGIGSSTNHAFAKDYWYITAGVVGLAAAIRGINYLDARARLKACRDASTPFPTRPNGRFTQAWAIATAVIREMSHPQLYIPIRGLRWTTPPPLGRILVLLAYWAVVIYLMAWKVSIKDDYYYERIGFRNAWVTMAQLPMLYLLAMKTNPIGFLIGSSHERLNWLHRWVARTMFVTATVHGFHFWTLWERAQFVEYALEVMPLIKYGLGAWGILLWLAFSGMLPLRRLWYEVWVAQHVIASLIILWLLYLHVPESTRYLIWMSVSFIVIDRAARWVLLAWRNIRIRPQRAGCMSQKRIGHHISLRAVGTATTVVTIKDVHFSWQAGQHIYLWLPRIGMLEAHPYTIACAHKQATEPSACHCNSIQLIIRAHGGFSKRLYTHAVKNPEGADLTGFLSGPYGVPPRWDIYETMVLVGASTGASFTIPILESVARGVGEGAVACIRKVEFVLLARTAQEMEYYIERAREAAQLAQSRGVEVKLHIAISGAGEEKSTRTSGTSRGETESISDIEVTEKAESKACCGSGCKCNPVTTSVCCCNAAPISTSTPWEERTYSSRLDIEALIREPVENAWGETAVVVCGGKEVVARTRNCVSKLSDERAVHKGTGAQGIYLYVEDFAF